MLVIQTSRAKRFRKYSIAFAIICVLMTAMAPLLTLHWYVLPPKK
jgi:t-SNARE complex subunit (syntaxin)